MKKRKSKLNETHTAKILNCLNLNGPKTADLIAGSVLVSNTRSAALVAAHLREMRDLGLVESFDAGERSMKWRVCRRVLSAANIIPFPVATTSLQKAA
jgi:hypothetical protein